LLEVDLQDLRSRPDDALDTKAPSDPSGSKVLYRFVHRAYLKIILEGAVGTAYSAMDEREVEQRCERGTWEGALEIVWARKREIEYLQDALGARGVLQDSDLPDPVRAFLEGVLESFPDLDIHLLAEARRREPSEEGHEALTKAMRALL
jgi:hypothetical protein